MKPMPIRVALRVRMPFGVHRDKSLEQVAKTNVLYLDWLAGLEDLRGELAQAIPVLVKHYATEIDAAIEEGEENEDDEGDSDRGETLVDEYERPSEPPEPDM